MASVPPGGGGVAAAALGPAIIGGASQLVGGALNSKGARHAADTQAKSAADALSFSREQESERKREWDVQQQQAAAAWKAKQDMLRPFNAGAYSVLAKYGIPVSMSGDQSAGQGIIPTPKAPVPPVPQQVAQTQPYGSPQASTMGQMMTGTTPVAGAFDWQSPFAKATR